jgi:hypothetical protein
VNQAIRLFALADRGRAIYTLIFFRSTGTPERRYAKLVEQMLRSFRGRA